MWEKIVAGAAVGLVLLCFVVLVCRIWKRNRYYKKVQHSLDEEERAFQETLARSYADDSQLDGPDQEKLQMLETYLSSSRSADADLSMADDAPMPTRAEDVDKFMAELVRAPRIYTREIRQACAHLTTTPYSNLRRRQRRVARTQQATSRALQCSGHPVRWSIPPRLARGALPQIRSCMHSRAESGEREQRARLVGC
jgi:hypothetical protein